MSELFLWPLLAPSQNPLPLLQIYHWFVLNPHTWFPWYHEHKVHIYFYLKVRLPTRQGKGLLSFHQMAGWNKFMSLPWIFLRPQFSENLLSDIYMTNTACQWEHKQFKTNKSQLRHWRRMNPSSHKQPCEQQDSCFSESSWHWRAHTPWWIGQRLTTSQLNDRLHSDSGDDHLRVHCLQRRLFELVWSNEPIMGLCH